MNSHHRSRAPRIWLLLSFVLLLTASQLAGGSAQTDRMSVASGYLHAVQDGTSLALLSSHAVLHSPEGVFAGNDGFVRYESKLDTSFDNISFAPNSAHSVGEYLLIEFMLSAIHTGDYLGAEPNCAGIVVPGLAVVQVTEDGITQQWISYDQNQVLNQIHVFGDLDSNTRPSCESQGFGESEPVADPAVAPGCIAANRCDEPH